MSLINDALKRAKQSQSPAPPPAGQHLHFRPVESDQSARHGLGIILPIVLALFALLGLFFVWELAHKNNAATSKSELVARASTSTAPVPAPAVNPPAPAISQAPPTPPAPPAAPQPEPEPTVVVPASAPTAPAPALVVPSAPAMPEEPPAPPKPAPLRLQGIAFSAAHPSAVINGKTVYVGDKLGEFRVSAITADSATLFNASQTNVLTLGD
jgi:outer membrane biosynthesis protein TonB